MTLPVILEEEEKNPSPFRRLIDINLYRSKQETAPALTAAPVLNVTLDTDDTEPTVDMATPPSVDPQAIDLMLTSLDLMENVLVQVNAVVTKGRELL